MASFTLSDVPTYNAGGGMAVGTLDNNNNFSFPGRSKKAEIWMYDRY